MKHSPHIFLTQYKTNMRLFDYIHKYTPTQEATLSKYLHLSGIESEYDVTLPSLLHLKEIVTGKLSPNSAKVILSTLSVILTKLETVSINYRPLLRVRGDRVNKTCLTPVELERLERLEALNDPNELNEYTPERPHTRTTGRTSLTPNERFVLNEFIVGCRTGARISDLELFTPANIQDGRLTYTSLKTGITATIPVSDMTIQRVKWLNECGIRLPLMTYNRIIKRLCERAGINEVVTVHQRGKDMTGPKYEFVSSHTARITMCTILANLEVPVLDIMRLAGHTDPAMTARYIVRTAPDLNDLAMNYLNK